MWDTLEKEDTRLCRLANGDLRDDEGMQDTEDVDAAAELMEDEREVLGKKKTFGMILTVQQQLDQVTDCLGLKDCQFDSQE